MDTRIWMQESFWESAEKQSVKESPQENAEHLSKDQNENGGNKLVNQKTSLWKQTYENILVGMGFCVIKLNFLLLYYILPFIGILMIFAGLRKLKQEDKWFKAGYAAAAINVVITMISIVSGTFINRRQIYDTYIWQFMLLWTFALPLIIASCFFCGMQTELKKIQKEVGITFIFVTHDQEEALSMSDTVVVMNEGIIQQIGSPVDIYNEPENRFVAKFIGESNILPGVMIEDYLVEFNGKRFESVDGGMRPNEPVEVVIRPEDLQITLPEEGKLQVRVETQLFRGVHYEIIAYDNLGNEWMIHSTRKAIEGEIIGLDFTPEDIHIMRLNETEEEFDARIEEYVEVEEHEDGLINAIEEERYEENS